MSDVAIKDNNKEVYRSLFHIVFPISFQMLMSSLVSASDAIMLGFLEQDSLSASSLAGQVAFVYSLFFGAFVFGLNVMAAQYWGKKDTATVSKILAIALRYTMFVGIIFSLCTLIIPKPIMRIFTSDEVLVSKGAEYLVASSLSYLLAGFSQCFFGVMKICDRAKLSSLIGSLAVVLNIGLNAILIFGLLGFPKMGIVGAAVATVIARLFEVVMVAIAIIRKKCPGTSIKHIFHIEDKLIKKDYWKYTFPLLINQIGWGGGVTMYSVIMGHLGTDATAANSIANIVRSMIASFCWGVASGVSIIIGGYLGRNEFEKAKKYGGKFVRMSILIGVVSGLVIVALIPLIMHFITLSDTANGYLKVMLLYSAYYIIGNSLNSTIISGIFPSGGDTRFGMICDVITLWVVVVPLGLLAAFVWNAPVLVVAFILTLDEFVKIPVVYRHYMKFRWVKNITRET